GSLRQMIAIARLVVDAPARIAIRCDGDRTLRILKQRRQVARVVPAVGEEDGGGPWTLAEHLKANGVRKLPDARRAIGGWLLKIHRAHINRSPRRWQLLARRRRRGR